MIGFVLSFVMEFAAQSYEKEKPMSETEKIQLYYRLKYPEKFWKAANSYSRSKKAWIPAKSLEKMELVISQVEKKQKFLEDVFKIRL